jgi:subtilisin family serine protease
MRKENYRSAAVVFLLVVVLAAALSQPLKSVQADVDHGSKLDPAVQAALVSMDDEQMITVIVTMRSQANLASIQATSRQERISQVINTLQNKANATQLHIRALLDRKKGAGEVASYESFWVFNGLAVTAKASVIDELAGRPEIATITANEIDVIEASDPALLAVSATPELNLAVVRAPQLWDLGHTGQGIVVANMDSGVDLNHPDLSGRWRGGSNSWFDPYGQHPNTPTDYSGHGTWTMGVMVGGHSGGLSLAWRRTPNG